MATTNESPITEVALLRLLPPTTADDVSLKAKLANAQKVMETYTGRTFFYLQQVEDPSLIYIVGEWASLKQHMRDFIPSADNQALLESLKDELTVEWLLHLDCPQINLPLPKRIDGTVKPSNATIFSIARHYIKAGEKRDFKNTFEENRHYLDASVTEAIIGGGCRVDKEEENEEFVLFCPWKDIEQHFAFGKTEDFAKYAKIRDHIDGADIKHAKILEL
ncbi:hypothetical protein BDV96DRAFT_565460 [Lophiotrema nucula]|uniref:ABM domain-containing protein n=1 Tax=Lophiotrema nucula TaxID=690887 RepID=A0A6A5ZM71_9PLEO|nr:hypothetical protein BDV96DRAFT_565460 [Lophiotrema nucula]